MPYPRAALVRSGKPGGGRGWLDAEVQGGQHMVAERAELLWPHSDPTYICLMLIYLFSKITGGFS